MKQCSRWQKILSANSTSANYPSRVPTVTKPTGSGVFEITNQLGWAPDELEFIFFGTDAANETLKAMLLGWERVADGTLWLPNPLWEVTATLGTQTGVAASDILNTDLIADTITLTTGYTAGQGIILNSPANDRMANIKSELRGYSLFEVIFDRNSSSASANGAWRMLW